MTFNSLGFIVFFAVVVILYFAICPQYRYIMLLLLSYGFYLCGGIKHTLLLMVCTLITYVGGILIEKYKDKKVKIVFYLCLILEIGILIFFKYINYLELFSHIVFPLGLSFYAFQSLGYLIDVYRGTTKAEKNLGKYALFVSFFPTILSGPIQRSTGLLKQIQDGTQFCYEKAKSGLLYMLLGYMEKLLIADRIGVLVSAAYSDYQSQTGASLLLAVVLYGIQIYCDFAGYSLIAIGAAKVLGFNLEENFSQPYFAVSIKDFWKRWHISLSEWLRDYVYISLGGSRCSKLKTYRNLMLTFLISGIWHGNTFTFLIWGALHGIYQILGNATETIRVKLKSLLRIQTDCFSWRLFQRILTFIMVDFAWLFFRADNVREAFGIIKRILTEFTLAETLLNRWYLMGMSMEKFQILLIEIIILIVIDLCREKQISIGRWLNQQNIIFRWCCYLFLSLILVFGVLRDFGNNASDFIYSNF